MPKALCSGDLLLPAMVLSRGIAYYVQLLFSAAVTLGAHILIDRRQKGT